MKPTEDQINDAMCKVSFPFFPGMTRGETEWKVKQFVAELFNIVVTQTSVPDGFRLVNEDELIELSDSILGNYYRGQDWERERITNMLEAAPKFGEEE